MLANIQLNNLAKEDLQNLARIKDARFDTLCRIKDKNCSKTNNT